MKKILRLTVTCMGLFLAATGAQASHLAGGNITYTQVSAGSYMVTLRLYRDCQGITMANQAQISVTGANCSTQVQHAILPMVAAQSGIEVSDVVTGQSTGCSTPPNNMVPGFQLFTYSGVVTVQDTTCTGFVFSYGDCCRNATTINLNNAASSDFYIETLAPNSFTGTLNTSPVWSGTPIPYVCLNDTVTYLPQATDPDGDSLVFSLIAAGGYLSGSLPYSPGFSATAPFGTSAYHAYDATTGLLSFKPTALGIYTVVQQIEEYRYINGVAVLVGTTRHDAEFFVMNCTSQPPRLSGTVQLNQNGNMSAHAANAVVPVVAGQPLTLDLSAITQSPNLTLSLTGNNLLELPGSMLSVSATGQMASGMLTWTPTAQQIRSTPYFFSYRFRDNAAPIPNDLYGVIKLRVQAAGTTGTAEPGNNPAAIPNVLSSLAPFSPVFTVHGAAAGTYSLTVYDRLGRQVYQSSRYANNWSGADVAGGLYLYRLQHVQTGAVMNGKLTVLK